ncbi:hypothetical protein PIB30_067359 [Stylosanthes scabra]|uniref:RRM domain-containing protein n=1 Tax=Stylosanthes scabra TaxID=79078 RepID=A0ABU6RN04_9FABA|nr:hypothetical protein [Stylosanthes scabra]
MEKNTFTVFVDNLPKDTTREWLLKEFNKVGKVMDVYLSMKRREKNPMRFAFVRFGTVEKARKAIEQYDRWRFWGWEKYRAKQSQELEESKIKLVSDAMAIEKLGRCLIGETLEPYDYDPLRRSLFNEELSILDEKMLGSMKVIMKFDSNRSLEEAYKSPILHNRFIEIRKWSPGATNGTRRIWIEVTGLPLHGWITENMTKVGSVWGKGPMIQAFEDVEIDGEVFRILVREVGSAKVFLEDKNEPEEVHKEAEEPKGAPEKLTGDEEVQNWAQLEESNKVVEESPTRIRTHEDDRRTEEIAKGLMNNERPTKDAPCNKTHQTFPSPPIRVNNYNPIVPESSSFSVPPGFEVVSQEREVEKNRARKEKQRRIRADKHQRKGLTVRVRGCLADKSRKVGRKGTKKKKKAVTHNEGSFEDIDEFHSEDNGDDSDMERRKTLSFGAESGFRAMDESVALVYLKRTADNHNKKNVVAKSSHRVRGRKKSQFTEGQKWMCLVGNLKEIGVNVMVVLVYAPNSIEGRREVWKEIVEVKSRVNLPVLAFGDFNEVLHAGERSSGRVNSMGVQEFNASNG